MKMRRVRVGTPLLAGLIVALLVFPHEAGAQVKAERVFNAVITDMQGVETDIKNVSFYWEEKISETAFVPHELRQLPVKRGTAMVQVKFDTIKQIDVKPGADKGLRPSALR